MPKCTERGHSMRGRGRHRGKHPNDDKKKPLKSENGQHTLRNNGTPVLIVGLPRADAPLPPELKKWAEEDLRVSV
ncbi:MAG: hypothetical protein JWO43_427 [Candidatus Adlerbacteria bacterium]|nr:hypothetical protein [Candidatus Adlerbacteria bacterium]